MTFQFWMILVISTEVMSGQQPSVPAIVVADLRLYLGMSETEVRGSVCDVLKCVDQQGSLRGTKTYDRVTGAELALIEFHDGKLLCVYKTIFSSTDPSAIKLAQSLFSSLSRLQAGGHPVDVMVKTDAMGPDCLQTIALQSGRGKRIEIVVFRGSADVMEVLDDMDVSAERHTRKVYPPEAFPLCSAP